MPSREREREREGEGEGEGEEREGWRERAVAAHTYDTREDMHTRARLW